MNFISKRIGALALCIMTLITTIFSGVPATVAYAEEKKSSTEELAAYFEANLDSNYATYSKMEPVDIIWVRQTLAERSKMPERPTLDQLFTETENAEGFITMLDSAEYIYDVDEKSDYFVAMIDTMKDDANAYVAEAVFARNNLNGERLDKVIYDYNTGICYIPRSVCLNDKGQQKIMEVQAQLLQLCDSAEPQTTVDVLVDNASANVYGKVEVEADATDLNTTIVVAEGEEAKNISADDITVHINGAEDGAENCIYSSTTGELTIPVSPTSLDSVEIEVKKENLLAKMFGPMTVHAISESDLAMADGRIEVEGTPHEGVVMQDVVTAYYWTSDSMETIANKDRIYGISGANVSDTTLQQMANNIATAAAGIDLSNLDQLGREYPWLVDLTGKSFTDGDGIVYHFSEVESALFPLKCGHITSPNTGLASVGTGGNDTANVVVHIYKAGTDYMIVGLLTPSSHTQTGMGIFKIPMTPKGKGAIKINKVSSDPKITNGNSCYSINGAKFGIYSDSDCNYLVNTLTTNSDGQSSKYEVDPGTYYVKEIEAPKGYFLSSKKHKVVINDGETTTVTVTAENTPGTDPIGLMLTKEDSDKKEAQGGAKLSGAQFTVKYYDEYSDTDPANAGSAPTYTWVLKTDANGKCYLDEDHYVSGDDLIRDNDTGAYVVPLGTLTIQETKAPTGYQINNTVYVMQTKLKNNGVSTTNKPTDNEAQKEKVIRGGIKVQKRDFETKKSEPMTNDASFSGITLEVVNKNAASVIVEGQEYAKDTVIKTITLDEKGAFTSANDLLPYGTYLLREKDVPQNTGYLKKGITERTFKIETNKAIVDLGKDSADTAIQDQIVRGGVKVQKRDFETKEAQPMTGLATFEGITMEIVNRNTTTILVEGQEYAADAVVKTFTTDSKGYYESAKDLLPYGKYLLREVDVPADTGYLKQGVIEQNFRIVEDGVLVDLGVEDETTAIEDQIMRGDFEIRKIDAETQKKMANIPFKVTSLTTGESHTFMTDDNGEYRSETEWIPHSGNTNKGTNGRKSVGDGFWFGQKSDGTQVTVNDELRALPYDDYEIEELPCDANDGKILYKDTFTIYSDNQVVYLNNIENKDFTPMIKTTATVDGKHEAEATGTVKIVDKVEYYRLIVGKEYTIKGVLMNKETGKELLIDGKNITAETTFTAEEADGSVELIYEVEASALREKTVVVFEDLYYNGIKLISHADIEDDEQTVEFKSLPPEIGTTATDVNTKDHLASNDGTISIIDVVAYKNLIHGTKYTVKGKLMDKSTKKALKDVDGKEVTASTEFTPNNTSGEVTVTFKFSTGEGFGGTDIVVFEDLLIGADVVATHSDIEDEGQTVHVPGVKTTATVNNKKEAEATGTVGIVDRVEYSHLIAGKEYTVKGILMNKETGKELEIDGKKITSEKKFKAEKSSGYVDLTFTVDASALKKKSVVVFENLYYGDILLAVHNDINDEGQTVTFTEPPVTTPPKTSTPKAPKTGDENWLYGGIIKAITKWNEC